MADITETEIALPARGGNARPARVWTGDGPVRLAMVVAHGMGEHGGRYRAPLSPLIAEGLAVYSLEHRGHGADAVALTGQGDFGAGGFDGVVADLHTLIERARADHPGVPLVLLAHSMGSMIAQGYVVAHPDALDGVVLSGALAIDRVPPPSGDGAALIGALNAPFAPARTDFDWLSRDEAEVDRYIADPLCGFTLTEAASDSIHEAGPRVAAAAVPRGLPTYIVSGDADPLHSVLGAWWPLVERFETAGADVTARLYAGGRHEMFNEINRDEVVADLAAWLDRYWPRTRSTAPTVTG